MNFINECGCKFEHEVLENAIDLECKSRNKYCYSEYKIFLHGDYPCICIGHDHVRIHVIIGKLLYGKIRKGYVIHHKDHDKLNNLSENLEYLSSVTHAKLHHTGHDYRTEEGKRRGINAAAKKRYKSQITKEIILQMQSQGKSIQEIAKELQCGVNTVRRRLGMKA